MPLTFSKPNIKGELKVTAKWLVCNDICIPESATFTSPLPKQTANAPVMFDEALKRTSVEVIANAHYAAQKDKVILSIPLNPANIRNVQFFPVEDGIITNTAAQQFSAEKKHGLMTKASLLR